MPRRSGVSVVASLAREADPGRPWLAPQALLIIIKGYFGNARRQAGPLAGIHRGGSCQACRRACLDRAVTMALQVPDAFPVGHDRLVFTGQT